MKAVTTLADDPDRMARPGAMEFAPRSGPPAKFSPRPRPMELRRRSGSRMRLHRHAVRRLSDGTRVVRLTLRRSPLLLRRMLRFLRHGG
jgi:hypothetical protein